MVKGRKRNCVAEMGSLNEFAALPDSNLQTCARQERDLRAFAKKARQTTALSCFVLAWAFHRHPQSPLTTVAAGQVQEI
jgi:hypothetical protein